MAYFPFFVDIGGKPGLIAGGGIVALRKIEKLQPFMPRLTVVAPEICEEIRNIQGLKLIERKYEPADEAGMTFVIAATDNRDVNRLIHDRCKAASIPINTVDDAELCSFIFPAIVNRGNLTVGISTGGSSPTAAICLKEKINEYIPENFEEILEFLNVKRCEIKKLIPDDRKRQGVLKKLFYECMEKGCAISDEELMDICRREVSCCE